MTDKKTKFDIANKILGEKIKQFEDNYRKKHLPESQEEKDKQSWVDDEGEWRCKKMRLAMTKKLKKEIKELFDELREYEREQGKLAGKKESDDLRKEIIRIHEEAMKECCIGLPDCGGCQEGKKRIEELKSQIKDGEKR